MIKMRITVGNANETPNRKKLWSSGNNNWKKLWSSGNLGYHFIFMPLLYRYLYLINNNSTIIVIRFNEALLFNYQDQQNRGPRGKNSTSCEKSAYCPLHVYWLLHFHTCFAVLDRDIKLSKIVCSILFNKNFFHIRYWVLPMEMLGKHSSRQKLLKAVKTGGGSIVRKVKTNTIQTGNFVTTERKLSI